MAEKISRSSRASKRAGSSRGAGGGEAAVPPAADPDAGAEPIVLAERITVIAETPLGGDDARIAAPAGERVLEPEDPGVTAEQRYRMIAERAYERARDRGFAPGRELEDWLLAEQEIDGRLTGM